MICSSVCLLRFIVWSFLKARLQFILDQFNGATSDGFTPAHSHSQTSYMSIRVNPIFCVWVSCAACCFPVALVFSRASTLRPRFLMTTHFIWRRFLDQGSHATACSLR